MLGIDIIALAFFLVVLGATFYVSEYKKLAAFLFAFKLLLAFIQSYYFLQLVTYDGDIEKFFRATEISYQFLKSHPEKILSFYFQSQQEFVGDANVSSLESIVRHLGVAKMVLPFYILAKGSFVLTLAYLSFFGTVLLYKSTVLVLNKENGTLFILCFIAIPSITFWTSGLQKEALLYPLWVYSGVLFVTFLNETNKKRVALLVLLLIMLLTAFVTYLLKFYYLIPLAALVGIVLLEYTVQNMRTYKIVVSGTMVLLAVATSIHPYISIFNFNEIIAVNYFNFCTKNVESCIALPIDGTTWGVLRAVPSALIKGILGPLPWEWRNALYIVQSLEHLLFIGFIVWMFFKYGMKKNFLKSFYLILLWCITMATLHVLTAPNYGSLSRYEAIYFPLLIFICLNQTNSGERIKVKGER
jgi:hypothetical protein